MKRTTLEQPFSGEIVFWTAGNTNRGALVLGWPISLKEFLPSEPTPAAALKAALQSIYAEKRTLIRPLEVEGAYAVVEETATETGVRYSTLLTAMIGASGEVKVNASGPEHLAAIKIRDAFNDEKSKLPGVAVTKALVKVVEALGGVPLRESGGVYWLPTSASERFQKVAYAVEGAGILRTTKIVNGKPIEENPNKVYAVLTPADERTARAVVDALTAEVFAEVSRIDEEIGASGDDALGDRALTNRSLECDEIIRKVARYEAIFGTSLTKLTESAANVKAAAMAAALAGAATEGTGT